MILHARRTVHSLSLTHLTSTRLPRCHHSKRCLLCTLHV